MVGLLAGRDWIVTSPILVPRRPISVYLKSSTELADFLVPFRTDTQSEKN
jgi:hypothetical protein